MNNIEFKIQDVKKSMISLDIIKKSRDDMTEEEFNDFMKLSLEQAEKGESVSVDEAFEEVLKNN